MKYEKPAVEIVKFDQEGFMTASGETTGWNPSQGVNDSNVYDFLASIGVTRDQISTIGGIDSVKVNPSTHTVICSGYKNCYGHQFQW